MTSKLKAEPVAESDSDSDLLEPEERIEKKPKLMRINQSNPRRFAGGLVVTSESEGQEHSASTSLSAAEKKGLKEVEELERELDLKNTFSKETNMRDENAEMDKYIEEQIRLRREAAKKDKTDTDEKKDKDDSDLDLTYMSSAGTDKIDDILLHSLSKHLTKTPDERSEAMLSSQMLNGIPEVDLGIGEKIRAIEATEEARLRLSTEPRLTRPNLGKKPSCSRPRR